MDDLVAVSFIVLLPSLNTVRIFRLCNNSTVYAAELTAIMETVYTDVSSPDDSSLYRKKWYFTDYYLWNNSWLSRGWIDEMNIA